MKDPVLTFELKPDLPPPRTTVGILGWVRANLFSSVFNTVLTLSATWLLWQIIPPLVEWFIFNATFSGNNRSSCEMRLASGDYTDRPGACWVFIKVRFLQIMFGLFYGAHPDQIWRPVLMFILFAIQIGLLFWPNLRWKPQLAAFIILVFPFVGYALLHGEWLGLPVAETDSWGGFMLTFVLAAIGIAGALPIGILLALGRTSNLPLVRASCIIFIESIRGVPLITLLFMASNMLPLFFPSDLDFDKVARALIAITLFQSAYTAEAIRGGLQAIPKGQYEAADAMGLGYWRKTSLVILPQALKISIPGIVNTFIALFKDTTLVGIIGLFDLLGIAQAASRSSEWKGYDFEGYIFAALIYFMFCYGMSRYSQSLERKLETGHSHS